MRLVGVLLAAVVAALGVTTYFVVKYGPSGRYSVETTLLRPDLLNGLNYNDYNPKTGANDRFVFDKLEFVYTSGKEQKKVLVPIGLYGQFYQVVNGDKSILDPPEEVKALFVHAVPTR